MSNEIDEEEEEIKLNNAVSDRVISQIGYNKIGDSYLTIYFTDGGYVTLSTLGGVEIEELN